MSLNWNGFGLPDSVWTIIVLLVGLIIGFWRTIRDRNVPYALVLAWAYGAILAKHLSASGFNGAYPAIIITTFFCLAVFAGSILYVGLKQKQAKELAK